MTPRVLVAGMGNELCRDDGFGIVTLRRFANAGVPEGVRVIDAGIGGIGLVQELMDGYDVLIILDAVERGGAAGTVYLLEIAVPELSEERRQVLPADMHLTVPARVLPLASALGVLPAQVYILGCQPEEHELGLGLSEPVERGVAEALNRLRTLIATLEREGRLYA